MAYTKIEDLPEITELSPTEELIIQTPTGTKRIKANLLKDEELTQKVNELDSSLNEIENKFVFSSNETLVGTFLGKNLYRKVITYTVTESNKTKVITFAHNIKNVDLIMIGQSVVKDKNGNFKSVNFINNDIKPSNICYCSADTTNIKLFCGNTLFVTGDVTAYITLEYTKTSDG